MAYGVMMEKCELAGNLTTFVKGILTNAGLS